MLVIEHDCAETGRSTDSLDLHLLDDVVLELFFFKHLRRARLELVAELRLFGRLAERGGNWTLVDRLILGDDGEIDRVAAHIVAVHSRFERARNERLALFDLQTRRSLRRSKRARMRSAYRYAKLIVALKNRNRAVRARAVARERQMRARTVRRNVVQMRAGRINAANQHIGANVAVVLKKILTRHTNRLHNARFASSVYLLQAKICAEHSAHLRKKKLLIIR